MLYNLLKKRITNKTYTSIEDMQVMLDLYFFGNRITAEQYEELVNLLQKEM